MKRTLLRARRCRRRSFLGCTACSHPATLRRWNQCGSTAFKMALQLLPLCDTNACLCMHGSGSERHTLGICLRSSFVDLRVRYPPTQPPDASPIGCVSSWPLSHMVPPSFLCLLIDISSIRHSYILALTPLTLRDVHDQVQRALFSNHASVSALLLPPLSVSMCVCELGAHQSDGASCGAPASAFEPRRDPPLHRQRGCWWTGQHQLLDRASRCL